MKTLFSYLTPTFGLLFALCLAPVSMATGQQFDPDEVAQGGATTHYKAADSKAFSHPAANMPFAQQMDYRLGLGIFKKLWVAAPSSTTASDGLGPLYNARSCMQCHRNNGRGHTPDPDNPADNAISLFLRLSIPPQTEAQRQALASGRLGSIPEPVYGNQLQDFAVSGLSAEGRLRISYREFQITLNGGEQVSLRKPEYHIDDPQFGPLHPQLMTSPRLTPPMIGLGLLERIPQQAILALSDPDDRDGDGISGRANWVWDQAAQGKALGRFGWKAGMPNLQQQNSAAFNGDIGISTADARNPYGDCTKAQHACLRLAHGASPIHADLEAAPEMDRTVLFFSQHIAVPARRNADNPDVLAGKQLFLQTGCARCHQPDFVTATDSQRPALSQQKIWPYTDLLLHDMGDGLADQRPEFAANGREWRTPPLWGIGLTRLVSGHTHFLHDGRARSLLEAILWHGGEARSARDNVVNMPVSDRAKLIKFLESL
ncbi:di-heme oxidoredictase family protein [Neptuniibacter halophilus]|uniref:di-heme oxidoreductase family protein n=1 Tax=Neptuniibacter halophilus TaxID=651666 RepID=UPI002573CF54|nr:di-heme oxidoredictase family protein [Neptuniibacter halophilus]